MTDEGFAEMRRMTQELKQLKSQARIAKLSQLMPSAYEIESPRFDKKADSKTNLLGRASSVTP